MTVFHQDMWADAIQVQTDPAGLGTAVLGVEAECGVFARDASGRIVHRYHLPRQAGGWLPYGFQRLNYHRDGPLEMNHFKGIHKYALRQCLRKIAAHRSRVSVHEVGSTIGENYQMLRHLICEDGLDIVLAYYGFDLDEDLVAASYVLFGHEPGFFAAVGECEVLAELPDRSLDFVTTLGVLNHAVDAPTALADALRVARVAFVGMIQVTEEAERDRNGEAPPGFRPYRPGSSEATGLATRDGGLRKGRNLDTDLGEEVRLSCTVGGGDLRARLVADELGQTWDPAILDWGFIVPGCGRAPLWSICCAGPATKSRPGRWRFWP